MSLQSIMITGYNSGVQSNKKPFLITDDAFSTLYNAYVWRERVKKREGLKLLGRLRRKIETTEVIDENVGTVVTPWNAFAGNLVNFPVIEGSVSIIVGGLLFLDTPQDGTLISSGLNSGTINYATGAITLTFNPALTADVDVIATYSYATGISGASPWSDNLWTFSGFTPEANADIEPGSVFFEFPTLGIEITDDSNGLLVSSNPSYYGFVDYLTGDFKLFHAAGLAPVYIEFFYFPSLPVMGISQREKIGINDEQTIFFDTKYAYIHSGADFQEFIVTSPPTTWNGTDSDFFWTTNYRGSEADERLFFVTNFVNDSGSPMRYTDGNTWTDFQPVVSGTSVTETLGTVVAPWAVFAGSLTNFPIIEGSVVITVGSLTFKDTPRDGTLVSSGLNTGTINYTTGAITLSFNPPLLADTTVSATYDIENTYLFTARILIPYYGRLVALNVYEGTNRSGATNIFNRARFSQVGNPIQQDAWRSDVFGKGGFVDAPINEEIVSARYYKNVLIVFFERSTWRLQYIGEYGIPFIWERISSDWGAESTFSTVLFDNGVLAVGDKAIVSSSGNDVQRIDIDIPDTVYNFKNADNGVKRVQGIRDFKKEVVYWCYPEFSDTQLAGQYFPNRTLLYNYRNNTFAFFRNNTTALGDFQYPLGITWDRLDIFWDQEDVFWDSAVQEDLPCIAAGNQQGFVHFFTSPDSEVSIDSTIDANDQESLSVSAVTTTNITGNEYTVQLTIINHNLSNDEWIYLAVLLFVDEVPDPPVVGSTTLNDKIYMVSVDDIDTITLYQWDVTSQQPYNNITLDPALNFGTYVGGGVVALFPKMEIQTKDFNPARQVGQNIQTSYIDFLCDATPNSQINVNLRMNTSGNANANVLVGNTELMTTNSLFGQITDFSITNPGVVESANHSLLDGDRIQIFNVVGTTQLNGNQYDITYVTDDSFSIGVDATGYTPYVSGGQWIQVSDSYYTAGAEYAWYRFFANSFGQFVTLQITYSQNQMALLSTHQSDFVMNAMQIYYRAAGNNIFGK